MSTLANISHSLRALVSLVILGLVGTGGWFFLRAYDERAALDRKLQEATAELAEKNKEIEKLTADNERLALAVKLLKIDHRVARIDVLEQDTEGRGKTKFKFVELTVDGDPVDEGHEFTIDGHQLYVDAWVIKYADELVEKGDPMAGASVCLFRRLFGEYQEPNQGFSLDPEGSRPSVYSHGNVITPLERDVWANFWDYANNPDRQKAAGLRAVHAEAPSMRLQLGKHYRLDLRSSGGLSIIPQDVPKSE